MAATARPARGTTRTFGRYETDGDGGGAWLEVDRLHARRDEVASAAAEWRQRVARLRRLSEIVADDSTTPPPSPVRSAAAAAEEEAAEVGEAMAAEAEAAAEAARWRREAEAFTREAMRVRAAQAATERQREAEEAGWRDFYKEVQSELRERGRQVMELQALSARLQREQEGAVPGPFMASLASTPRSRTPPRRGGDYDRPSPGTVSPRSPGGGPPRTPRRSPADGSADTPRRLAEVDASLRGARGALAAHAEHAAELDAENERLRRELHEVNARARKLKAALAGMADELG